MSPNDTMEMMEEIAVDLSVVEEKAIGLMPKGKFRWAIKDMNVRDAGTGSKRLGVLCEIVDILSVTKGQEERFPFLKEGSAKLLGRTQFVNVTLVKESYWVLKRLLMACGASPDLVNDPAFKLRKDDWLGKQYVADLNITKAQDGVTDQNEINPYSFRALTEAEAAKML